ncbi:tyrosine-type recombinase/integrase [Candidatus Methanomassiliicoccus intestinalis]|uniref:tyrosine-type recombinase/integrase n=1 Tax=Candidatus Methanomassiliicoccus intestinalis TaxID=1406512 RepID=UPI0037DDA95A
MPYKYRDAWHVKMRAYEKRLRAHHNSEQTITVRKNQLSRVWEILGKPNDPLKVPLEEYQSLESHLESIGLMPNTIVNYITALKLFLKFCKYPDAEEILTKYEAQVKEDRVFLEEEYVSDAREIAHKLGARYELAYSLAVDNSLRRGDITRITLNEAQRLLETGRAHITQKGNRKRLLILHKKTLQPLRDYLDERESVLLKKGIPGDPYLFLNFQTGKRLSPDSIYCYIIKISEAMGTYFRPHDLRATYVRRQARAGTKPYVVMMNAGHKSWSTTFKNYYGEDEQEMENAQDRI